jgi:hypothetical protein
VAIPPESNYAENDGHPYFFIYLTDFAQNATLQEILDGHRRIAGGHFASGSADAAKDALLVSMHYLKLSYQDRKRLEEGRIP